MEPIFRRRLCLVEAYVYFVNLWYDHKIVYPPSMKKRSKVQNNNPLAPVNKEI